MESCFFIGFRIMFENANTLDELTHIWMLVGRAMQNDDMELLEIEDLRDLMMKRRMFIKWKEARDAEEQKRV